MLRTIKGVCSDIPEFYHNGTNLVDTSEIDYMGVSLKVVSEEPSMLSLIPEIDRGVLWVGGSSSVLSQKDPPSTLNLSNYSHLQLLMSQPWIAQYSSVDAIDVGYNRTRDLPTLFRGLDGDLPLKYYI